MTCFRPQTPSDAKRSDSIQNEVGAGYDRAFGNSGLPLPVSDRLKEDMEAERQFRIIGPPPVDCFGTGRECGRGTNLETEGIHQMKSVPGLAARHVPYSSHAWPGYRSER